MFGPAALSILTPEAGRKGDIRAEERLKTEKLREGVEMKNVHMIETVVHICLLHYPFS